MKKISSIFSLLAVLLTNVMIAVVAYNYGVMKVRVEHFECSAPADVVFVYAIPFLIGIFACVIVAVHYKKHGK